MQDEMKPQVQQPQVDHSEAQMARADLYRGAKNAMKLFQMVQDGQQLEGWVQAKITKAADYLDSVYHYMEYQAKFGQGGVATSLDDITSDAQVSTKQGEVSEEDDEEGIKESMNYEQKLQALLESAKKKMMKPAKKDEQVEEGWDDMMKAAKEKKGTGKFDKKEIKPGVTQYTRKSSTFDDGGDDSDTKAAKKKAKKVKEGSTGDYSAKKAAAGKDIGKPGKQFAKIAAKAEKGGAKSGAAVAGAVLKKLRAKEDVQVEGAKPDFLDMDKDGNKKEPMKKAVADKKKNPFAKVKEADDRAPAKKKEREITLPSGAKTKATTVQGWQSQKADKSADKEKKDTMKESVMESAELKSLKFLAGLK